MVVGRRLSRVGSPSILVHGIDMHGDSNPMNPSHSCEGQRFASATSS